MLPSLLLTPHMRNAASLLWHAPRRLLAGGVTLYQRTLSPDHGPLKHLYTYGYCRHSPTCSEYAKRTILQRGVLIGVPLTVWRVLGCNPWRQPSYKRLREAVEKHLR